MKTQSGAIMLHVTASKSGEPQLLKAAARAHVAVTVSAGDIAKCKCSIQRSRQVMCVCGMYQKG